MSRAFAHSPISELLIAGLDPAFIERGVLWFEKEHEQIKKARHTQSFFAHNTAVITERQRITPYSFMRLLEDLGYERAFGARKPGTWAHKGGLVEVFPINTKNPFRIEFFGNVVESISSFASPIAEKDRERELKRKHLKEQSLVQTLKPREYVVHADHGVGIYKGTEAFATDTAQQYLILEYAPPRAGARPDRLLVPLRQIKKVSRYIGFITPSLHRLGSQSWITTRRKATENVIKMAKELLALYGERERATRPPYSVDASFEHELARTFPHEETPDQLRAIKDVTRDLMGRKPMDRLVCADVGFGKTEVALRAAALVASAHKQVALLAPTTVLADQHFSTFTTRMRAVPLRVALLSRLEKKTHQRKTVEGIKNGTVDIVIGTHRLLASDIAFRDLGLLIIDEEQRFGVRQKERLKSLKSSVDVLSLSATPIPRTLHMILSGLKPVSIIETPPRNRETIETTIAPFDKELAHKAIMEEIKRKGQIYWLHNRIETLGVIERTIKELAPRITIATIHGRMNERALRDTMKAFRDKKADVLLATTIIENGLDLTNVNTLIVDDATRLGLSQAHQIRGRIGRSHKKAFAYFFHPERMTDKAKERLRALQDFQQLGSGFKIAKRDLEIRGAGNIVGREQSGTLNQVGLNLYCQMLSQALEEISQGKVYPPEIPLV